MSEAPLREIDPFDYFVDHASAIAGQGGQMLSPDPRYCFHTHYYPVRPGPAVYHLKLSGVRSTMGELAAHVHAHRADGTSDVLFVAGTRMEIGPHKGEEISLSVRFRAVRDVHYAFYGFFTEASDLMASDLRITLEELEDEDLERDPLLEDVPTSPLADRALGSSASQASALVLGRPASLDVPVSQDCTERQLRMREFQAEAYDRMPIGEATRLWSEIVCRQALVVYSAAHAGVKGLELGGGSALLAAFCDDRGMSLRSSDWRVEQGLDVLAEEGHFDFLVSSIDLAAVDEAGARYAALVTILSRLLVGGLGLVCIRYVPDTALPSSTTMSAAPQLTRNEIGQWVLRLIGSGFSAAPLAFAAHEELALDESGRATIVLVLRRL